MNKSIRDEYLDVLLFYCTKCLVLALHEQGPRKSDEVLVIGGKLNSPDVDIEGGSGVDADWASSSSMWVNRQEFEALFASFPERHRADCLHEFDDLVNDQDAVSGLTPVFYMVSCGGVPVCGGLIVDDLPQNLVNQDHLGKRQ